MERTNPYYQHSGKISLSGIALSLAAIMVMPPVFGVLGSAFKLIGTYFIDIGILGVLLTGALAGGVIGRVIRMGKVRNEKFAFWTGICAGMSLLVWVWFWFYILLQTGDIEASTGLADGAYFPWEDPQRMFSVIHTHAMAEGNRAMSALLIYAVAYFTRIFYFAVEFPHLSGPWLYLFWVLEAGLLVIWTGARCKEVAGKHGFVFCENCNQETKVLFKSPLLRPMPANGDAAMTKFLTRIEQGDFAALETLAVTKAVRDPGTYSRLLLRGCEKCRDFYCADIISVGVEWDSEDYQDSNLREVDGEDDLIVEHLLLPTPWYERLRGRYESAANIAQTTEDPETGPWLVISVVGGTMILAMAVVVVFNL